MYDFDNIVNRKNSSSIKWDYAKDSLPMWVADQDFKVFPKVKEAILKRLDIEAYGYQDVPEEFGESVANWFNTRYNAGFNPKDIIFCEGVVATISSTVRHLLNTGDKVVVMPPVYNIFYNSIINNKMEVVEVPLINNDLHYEIDFKGLEETFKDELVKMLIFCNPENPTGRLWTKEELEKIGYLCNKYNVIIISDEIHCDLVTPGKHYIPFASVNEVNKNISITCVSPSKTFNMAGIKASAIIISNPDLYKKVIRAINTDEVAEPNYIACDALMAAYNEGNQYVEELNQYLYDNKKLVVDFINKNLPHLKVKLQDSLYLLWIDASYYKRSDLKDYINKYKLLLSDGKVYGKGGEFFLRMNVATSIENVKLGLLRLQEALNSLE